MDEEQGTTEVVGTETVEAAETTGTAETTSTSFIDSDGTFTDGWRDKYLTEDIRDNGTFKEGRVKNVQGLFKSLASAERMIGADKIAKPSDSYSESDWEEWHNLGGRPQNATDYALKSPDGLPEGMWSEERANQFMEVFHKAGLSKKQVEVISEAYNADIMQQVTDMGNNSETAIAQLESDLLTDKGNAFTQFKHNGNFAIEKGTEGESDEFKQRVIAKFGTDPDLVRLLGNLGGQFAESGSVPVERMNPTPIEVQDKINVIMASPAFNDRKNPGHKAAIANITRLQKEKSSVKQPA